MAEQPKVFISYSHDSPDHKQWVGELAIRLRHDGIDVTLDQWDLGPGDDITLFMEKHLHESDRVLCVCTDEYVRKADAGEGGVGYERMIVTAELLRNISTDKIIPIVRQPEGSTQRPKFLETRFYVDLSNDDDKQYDLLLRELHSQPPPEKPPVGQNPFAKSPSGREAAGTRAVQPAPIPPDDIDASAAYEGALQLARAGDLLGWRQLAKRVRASALQTLREWRAKYEANVPQDRDTLHAAVDEAVSGIAPLLIVGLVGVESGREELRDQRAIVDDLLNITGWQRSGRTLLIGLPKAMVYVYQGLHGAMALATGQIELALALADMMLEYSGGTMQLFRQHDLVGWPDTLEHHCHRAWRYLVSAGERWGWLPPLFGEDSEFRRALSAYYLALNTHELAEMLSREGEKALTRLKEPRTTPLMLDVPLEFIAESREVLKGANALLVRNANLTLTWESFGIEEETMRRAWPLWIAACQHWITHSFGHLPVSTELPHAGLFER